MKKQYRGIQVIGTQRSGSNLLRVILGQSEEISAPHPPHILKTFGPMMHKYQPLHEANYKQLISDVVDFVEANPVAWTGVALDCERILKASARYSLFEIFRLVYGQAAAAAGANYWCCKSMDNAHFAEQMEAAGIHPKYIYLYRDGRDVAVSFKKAVVGDKHVYHLAKKWKADQEQCLALKKKIDGDRFFSLAYEDLIQEPEKYIRNVCEFLAVPFEKIMLEYYKSPASLATACSGQMWKNLKKPVISDNCRKFERELSREEIEIFESVAGETLEELGYPTLFERFGRPVLSKEAIRMYDLYNQLEKDKIEDEQKLDMQKRAAQINIIERIQKRGTERSRLVG